MIRRPPRSTLFPYTPLSRSQDAQRDVQRVAAERRRREETLEDSAGTWFRKEHLQGETAGHGAHERHDHRLDLPESEPRSEEHTSELQSPCNLVCRLLLEKKN